MKHLDEVVPVSTVQLAKRRQYQEDIDSLIEDYERLLALENRSTRRIQVLEKDLGAMRRARDNAKRELKAESKRRHELQSTLKALRSSRSLRVGRAIGRPAQALKGVLSATRRIVRGVVARRRLLLSSGAIVGTSIVSQPIVAPADAAVAAPSAGPVGHVPTREQLVEAFSAEPSKGAAVRLISHDYFQRGAIVEPAEFIRKHSSLLSGASGTDLALLQNVLGQSELLLKDQFLSPRQPNAGYTVERHRIMYCAHSTGHFNSNGYSTRTAGVVGGLKANDEDVVVVARPGYPWDAKVDVEIGAASRFELEIGGVTHVYNPGPSWTGDRLDYYLAESVDVYVREAQRNRVSLIHAASNFVAALPALMAARRLGIPFVYEVRGLWEITQLSAKPGWEDSDRFKLAVRLETLVAKEADAVLAITSQVRDELVERGVDASAISLTPNSVDTDAFSPLPPFQPLRKKLGLTDDTIVVGYAGSLVAYEGLADLLDAMKIVLDESLDIRLVIVGDGAQLPELKKQAREIGIQKDVIFTGRVASGEVTNYISLFDIMPCPRRQVPVTEMVSPLKPLEAMASAKAIILSNLGPSRELAGPNQERALLCEAGNPSSLAGAILSLASSPALRSVMGKRARLWTIEERTWKTAGIDMVHAHGRARKRTDSASVRKLAEMTLGVIADRFTLEGLQGEASLVALRPESWEAQLAAQPLDALLVESAWEGIDDLWKQKVGYYDDEKFSTLKAILDHCNQLGVPTIFWNKEDPVHFNRFSHTSKFFDHVFTTDSACIRRYKANPGERQRTVGSLPFYAQPRMHNIAPSGRPYDHSVAYAGSYYGDKYKSRSEELSKLLDVCRHYGLSIYDRQHLNADSPYRFPEHLARFVRGGLDYSEMVRAYKAHPVHVNVNSVDGSPTMFSRRVMEIAASGAAVISGTGLGVEQIMNGLVPVVANPAEADLLVQEWMTNEQARNRDAWLAYRHVYRGHTAAHRLAYVLRTAGLQVQSPEPPAYAVFIESLTPEVVSVLKVQTIQPARIYCVAAIDTELPVIIVNDREDAKRRAKAEGIPYVGEPGDGHGDRTVFEDMLTATSFGSWSSISISGDGVAQPGLGLAEFGTPLAGSPQLGAVEKGEHPDELRLRRELIQPPVTRKATTANGRKTVLIAGHDLKFAGGAMSQLEALGHRVIVDKWDDHNKHNEAESRSLLIEADVIFCEWTLGNAVWYSRNKLPHQRLVSRLHLQEIFRPFVKEVDYHQVDEMIFVGQHILEVAVRDHNVPRAYSRVIPNAVDIEGLHKEKHPDARFNLGLVGIVPARKRLDMALEVLRMLRKHDDRYRLFIKGKRPEDFPWMANRPEEMAYYEEQYQAISSDPLLAGAVFFDGQGDDMAEWYRKIGVVISVSDFESFHLTLPDGAASGAVPASLAWPGADQIYPTTWLHPDEDAIAQHLLSVTAEDDLWKQAAEDAQTYAAASFDSRMVLPALADVILGVESR